MTATQTNGYTLAEATEFARTIRQDPEAVFGFEGARALRTLAAAKERRRFDRVIDAAAESSELPDILARLEYKCVVADHGAFGLPGKAWNDHRLPALGPTQAYFQKKYGTPYTNMMKARNER